jgi:hypothetical protein
VVADPRNAFQLKPGPKRFHVDVSLLKEATPKRNPPLGIKGGLTGLPGTSRLHGDHLFLARSSQANTMGLAT